MAGYKNVIIQTGPKAQKPAGKAFSTKSIKKKYHWHIA